MNIPFIFSYLLEASVCLVCFYFFYYLVFRKDTFLMFNRMFIISSIVLSLIIPLLEINYHSTNSNFISPAFQEPTYEFSSPDIKDVSVSFNYLYIKQILFYIYLFGVGISTFKLGYQVFRLMLFIKRGEISTIGKHHVIFTNGLYPTSSFFHYILWDNTVNDYSEVEKQSIIKHEMIHINQFHTIDNLFMELVKALFWFNPIVYYYNSSLKLIHEFLADENIVSKKADFTIEDYQSLISKQLLNNIGYQISNNFNMSNLKKRLIMISKTKTKRVTIAKSILTIPVVAGLLLSFSFKSSVANVNTQNVKTKTFTIGNKTVLLLDGVYQRENIYVQNIKTPKGEYTVSKVLINGKDHLIEVDVDAFEVPLSKYYKSGDKVKIEIYYSKGTKPKVLNPEVLSSKTPKNEDLRAIKESVILPLEGVYQEGNIYVQNVKTQKGEYTVSKVLINGKDHLIKIDVDAFEVPLSKYYKSGDKVKIEIYYSKGTKPKVLNSEVLKTN